MWKTGMEGGGRNGFHVYSNALFIYFFIFFFFNTINCRIWYTKLCKKNSWNNNSKIVWYHVNDRKQFTVIIHKASSSYLFFFFYSLYRMLGLFKSVDRWSNFSWKFSVWRDTIWYVESKICASLIILEGYLNDRDEAYLSGSGNTKNRDIET